MMFGRPHLASILLALLAVAWGLADVHAASPQPLRFAGRRLRGPAAESESRSLVPSTNATTAQPQAKLFGATSPPTSGNPNVTLIGGFKIPHINQQVGFGGGPGTAYRALPPNAAAQGGGDAYRQLIVNPSCEASVTVSMPWACGYQGDGRKFFCASIAIIFKNWGDTKIPAPWALHLNAPSYLGVREAYNWNVSSTDSSGDINGKVTNDWQSLKPGGEAIPSLGGIFTGSVGTSTAFVPAHITVNNDSCTIITLTGQGAPARPAPTNVTIIENPPSLSSPNPPPAPTLPVQPPFPPSLPAPPLPPPPPPNAAGNQRGIYQYAFTVPTVSQSVAIDGDNTGLIGVDGQPLLLRGINWFGYEDGNTAPDGIWYGSTALSLDIVTIVRRMKLLGYNAVRLPFSFIDLFTEAPKNFNRPCTELSDQQLLNVTTEPGVSIPAGTQVDSTLPFSPAHIAGSCNDYLPNDSTFARFLWNVHLLAANGMYVLIDDHSNFDTTIVTNYTAWLAGWKRMMSNIALDPVSKPFVMYDILNEPDSQNLGWDFMTKAYLDVMEQGSSINPDAVYFVEGCGQGQLGANWGDGFTTNTSLINPGTSNDPNKFFTTLVSSSYHVVVSPHVYPPTITTATSAYTGPAFWTRLSFSFGHFNTGNGYCTSSGQCKKFPVVIGEFGSRLTDPRDIACLNDFKEYIQNTGPAVDGMHAAITSWFWWAWNANSADTGGMVEDDWTTIIWNKVDYHKSIGLQPWYTQLASGVTESTPTSETSSVSPPPPPPPPPPTQTRSQPTQAPTAEPTQQPTKQPTEQSSPPPTGPASAPPPQPPPSPPAAPEQLATWSQCGGKSGCPKDSGTCSDAPWSARTCGPGDGCVRSDQWYWQCRRGEATTVPTAAPTAAPTAEPTSAPTPSPTAAPSSAPTQAPTMQAPTSQPTAVPTPAPQTAALTPVPTQAPTPGTARVQTMARFYQCGGKGGGCTGTCEDAVWSGIQCEQANSCTRQNEWYWQCLPADVPTLTPTSAPTSAPTPVPQSQPTSAPTSSSDGDQNRELGFDLYAQCGGKSNCPSGVNCGDNAWDKGCSSGSCLQQSEWYWQCLPSGSSPSPTSAPQAQPSPAPTSNGDSNSSSSDDQNRSAGGGTFGMYAQCGGASNCPSDVNCGDNVWNSGCSNGSCQRQSQWYYQCL